MYALPKRPKEKEQEKVRLSFSNWILGGPILQPVNREEHIRRRSSGSRRLELVVSPDEGKVKRRVTVGGEKAAKEAKCEEKAANEKAADSKPADEKLAEEKSAEEKKSEDGDEAKEKEGGKKEKGEKGFTAEQDADILKMKGVGKTWREIATAVKRSQKDCQVRFKELEKGEKKDNATTDGEPAPVVEEEKPNKKDKKGEKKGDKVENAKKRKTEEQTGAEDAGGKRLKADDIWTKDDCKMLEMLEERYREQKWLQIQASFYNHTGRMVIADLIEKKFQEVEP